MNELKVPLPPILEEVDGEIRVKGHRITLYHIITAYNEKWINAHAMVFYYPTLSLYQIEKVLEFYHANQQAVLEYVANYKSELEKQYQEGSKLDIADLKRRFEAKKAAGQVQVMANGHPNPRTAEEPLLN